MRWSDVFFKKYFFFKKHKKKFLKEIQISKRKQNEQAF